MVCVLIINELNYIFISLEGRKLCKSRQEIRFGIQNEQHHDDHGR